MTERIVDYSLAGETVREHLLNCLALLDSDTRRGLWERRVAQAAVRRRIEQALELLEHPRP
jgi:hypothetical protein